MAILPHIQGRVVEAADKDKELAQHVTEELQKYIDTNLGPKAEDSNLPLIRVLEF